MLLDITLKSNNSIIDCNESEAPDTASMMISIAAASDETVVVKSSEDPVTLDETSSHEKENHGKGMVKDEVALTSPVKKTPIGATTTDDVIISL